MKQPQSLSDVREEEPKGKDSQSQGRSRLLVTAAKISALQNFHYKPPYNINFLIFREN